MQHKSLFLILLGPPMSGKGTQATRLTQLLGIPQVASGDLFRDNIKNQTNLGRQAKKYIDRGDLVPDEVTIGMVKDRLQREDCQDGALLDGFPRTIPQADALDKILADLGASLAVVISIAVPEDVLVERASGRRLCRTCGRSYHLNFGPPQEPGLCDDDGGELYQRDDDVPETVLQRLQVYQAQTSPLIDFYHSRGILQEINGDQPIDEVAGDIELVLNEL
ncbi:MAG: adenylate kinase [Anaerolineales bacterium]